MPHFFIESNEVKNGFLKIMKGDNYTHLKSALRVRVGEKVLFIDENYIQYETVVKEINNQEIVAKIEKQYLSTRFSTGNIFLAQSLLKTDAQNYVVQKATELGVKAIFPLITDNCVIKKNVAEQKIPHLQKIAYESCKQCERPDIPVVHSPQCFDFIFNKDFEHVIVCAERHAQVSLMSALAQIKYNKNDKILLVIGPEGGFSEKEFTLMKEHGVLTSSLGNLILRADTAVIAALSVVMLSTEN